MNKQIKAGADIHAGDGGYSEGTQEGYDAFVKVRNKSLAQGRIRDLAEQSGFRSDVTVSDGNGVHIVTKTEQSLDKFAELIVKECINEIAYIGKANEVFGDRTDRGGLNHILWTTETAIEKIKEHFGVEE